MTTSPKTPATSRAQPGARPATAAAKRPAVKAAAKPVSKAAANAESGSFLRFYHSEALREKTLRILVTLEEAPDPTQHRQALADVVVELTNAGMDYYFIKQLKRAKAGFILQQSANLGMVGALQVMGGVIRNIIGRMDEAQLRSVCGSIRDLSR